MEELVGELIAGTQRGLRCGILCRLRHWIGIAGGDEGEGIVSIDVCDRDFIGNATQLGRYPSSAMFQSRASSLRSRHASAGLRWSQSTLRKMHESCRSRGWTPIRMCILRDPDVHIESVSFDSAALGGRYIICCKHCTFAMRSAANRTFKGEIRENYVHFEGQRSRAARLPRRRRHGEVPDICIPIIAPRR
jgi:hypothetical protein